MAQAKAHDFADSWEQLPGERSDWRIPGERSDTEIQTGFFQQHLKTLLKDVLEEELQRFRKLFQEDLRSAQGQWQSAVSFALPPLEPVRRRRPPSQNVTFREDSGTGDQQQRQGDESGSQSNGIEHGECNGVVVGASRSLDSSDQARPSTHRESMASTLSSAYHKQKSLITKIGDKVQKLALGAKQSSAELDKAPKSGLQTLTDTDRPRTEAGGLVDRFVIRNEIADLTKAHSHKKHDQKILDMMVALADWWGRIEEPAREGMLDRFVESGWFELLCVMVILLNSIFIAYSTDWEMQHIGSELPGFFTTLELMCTGFFVFELFLRLLVHRLYFFVNDDMKLNLFDFFLVTFSVLNVLVSNLASDVGEDKNNWVLMRVLRLLKLAKIFRAIRVMRFFKDLVVIMQSLKNSMFALFWIFVMLMLMMYVFSLVFMQGLIEYLRSDISEDDHHAVIKTFGSMPLTMLSLYSGVTGGNDWMFYFNLVEKAGPTYAILFVCFTFFFLFAMFNILTGLFVEKATVAAAPDADEVVLSQKKKTHNEARELRALCEFIDEDKSGSITWAEFEEMMYKPVLVAYLASIGLEVHEPELFFSIICGDASTDLASAEIEIDDFVDGCMRMKGFASSIDARRQLFEIRHLHQDLKQLANDCQKSLERMDIQNNEITARNNEFVTLHRYLSEVIQRQGTPFAL